jgi:mRNA interferase YafQ
MYSLEYTGGFLKQAKQCQKRGYDMTLLEKVIQLLAKTGKLTPGYKPHKLSGKYAGCWECHIKPDWLLVWQQNDSVLTLLFMNTGTHSDLFK